MILDAIHSWTKEENTEMSPFSQVSNRNFFHNGLFMACDLIAKNQLR